MSPSDQQPRRRITRHYAHAFLFSVRTGSPLARLHVITKAMLVLGVSALVVRFMRTGDPDPVGAGLLMLVSFGLLLLSGAGRWLFRSYLGAIFPMLCLLTLVWIVFNPNPGSVTYFSLPLHDGVIDLRLTPWLPLFAVSAALAGRLARRRPPWLGLLLGFVVAHAAARLPGWPAHPIARLTLFQPISLLVSDANLLLALTKAMGYAALVFVSLLFMMTTRDTEFLGAHILRRSSSRSGCATSAAPPSTSRPSARRKSPAAARSTGPPCGDVCATWPACRCRLRRRSSGERRR